VSHREGTKQKDQKQTESASLATRLLTGVSKPKPRQTPISPSVPRVDELDRVGQVVIKSNALCGVKNDVPNELATGLPNEVKNEAKNEVEVGNGSANVESHEASALPDLATLTPQSDFSPFMVRGVSAALRSAALKTLFTDPHFNVMDKLDVYVDDYSVFTPMPEGWACELSGVKEAFAGMKEKMVLFPHEVEEAVAKTKSEFDTELKTTEESNTLDSLNAKQPETLSIESAANERSDNVKQPIAKPINEDK
jgi:hypothetical protein